MQLLSGRILHVLTPGPRCTVSAWIPVSNYLSASLPVITRSSMCQGQVTSRWAWLRLNGALSPILSQVSAVGQKRRQIGLRRAGRSPKVRVGITGVEPNQHNAANVFQHRVRSHSLSSVGRMCSSESSTSFQIVLLFSVRRK